MITRIQAIGGAIAIVFGAFVLNAFESFSIPAASAGSIVVQDASVSFSGSTFMNCRVASVGIYSGSLGSTSVYGGALAVLQSLQLVEVVFGVITSTIVPSLVGFNFTFDAFNSSFIACSARTNSTAVRPGTANGGGGAVYLNSVAFSNVTFRSSTFINCTVNVASGASGVPSNCSGGAISLEILTASNATLGIFSCTILNCAVVGIGLANLAIRGGGVAVSRAAAVSVASSTISGCSIIGASSVFVVSGGAGISATLVRLVSLINSSLDAADGLDESGTSAGLLVLPSASSFARISITNSSLSCVGSVALNITCIDDTGFFPTLCVLPGPWLSLANANISQLASSDSSFLSIGSNLLALQQNVSFNFSNSFVLCNSTQFAVFIKQSYRFVVVSCSQCPEFQIALTANRASLERLVTSPVVDRGVSLNSQNNKADTCPFGIVDCSTYLNVTSGFWTAYSNAYSPLKDVVRCPPGYCSCNSSACPLNPPLSISLITDSLCSGNRIGVLCGGCAAGFTQSWNGQSCISNDDCSQNLWWVWTLSILWYTYFALYITISCGRYSSGAVSCLLFYFQMSFLASSLEQTNASNVIGLFSQFQSILALYSKACYAPNMSAYNATAAKLIGPVLVFVMAIAWTRIIQILQPRLKQRNLEINVSYGGTIAATTLFVFSNVINVVFALVDCTGDGVVFIDGTVQCYDATWIVLIFIVVLLILFPVAFAMALKFKKLSQEARAAACRSFKTDVYYWGALTLTFRLLMSLVQFLQIYYPNMCAFFRLSMSIAMFCALLLLRPYLHPATFSLDVVCYCCLIVQFSLQVNLQTQAIKPQTPTPAKVKLNSSDHGRRSQLSRCVPIRHILKRFL